MAKIPPLPPARGVFLRVRSGARMYQVEIDEPHRQMVLLALATLQRLRPGWALAIGEAAECYPGGRSLLLDFVALDTAPPPADRLGRLGEDGSVQLPAAVVARAGLQPGDFVYFADAPSGIQLLSGAALDAALFVRDEDPGTDSHQTEPKCPICDAAAVSVREEQVVVQAPFGPRVTCVQRLWTCRACGEDSAPDDLAAHARAEGESERGSVRQMLADLAARGVTSTYIERALSLPFGTLARLVEGAAAADPVGLALLRLVRTYPWLLAVADEHFDEDTAARLLSEAASASAPRPAVARPAEAGATSNENQDDDP